MIARRLPAQGEPRRTRRAAERVNPQLFPLQTAAIRSRSAATVELLDNKPPGARRWVQGDVGHHRSASSLQICERGGEECHACGPRERAWVSFKAESEGLGKKNQDHS
ncbi:hypothetical protein E1301_Tti014803 [Triplophysa tibetana]|uniref:Uncharacterized protein n=1 Tax=Triplophysa tibetana TaxID=1572043 RepID=A0A5A9PT43_9TELE|nr:hypothetical protein E1301_Tti014803 [Triplophysa tibetana]